MKYGFIASKTRGSRGVVEMWSKKIGAMGMSVLLGHLELGHLVLDQLDVLLLLLGEEGEHGPKRRVLDLLGRLLVLPEIVHLVPERQSQHLGHRPIRHRSPPIRIFPARTAAPRP